MTIFGILELGTALVNLKGPGKHFGLGPNLV